MPNVKIFVDETLYPACRAGLGAALGPMRDYLCAEFRVDVPACQFAVLPVLVMPDLPRVMPVLRGLPVPLTRWLIGPETATRIGIDEHVSWATRLVFQVGRLLVGVTDGVVGLVVPGFSLSRLFTRAVGYHLLTRFLMNQTRPLALPDRVLNPMGELITGWSHDPLAPGWVNRLEDRLTTTGDWHRRPLRGVHATDGAKAG